MLEAHPHVFVLSDEIYEHVNYTGTVKSFASIPGMFERTITVNGFSKGYAMTGWRVGYVAAPSWFSSQVAKLQGHLSSANCSIAQRAALAALSEAQNDIAMMVSAYHKRRDYVYDRLQRIDGIKTILPDGAFYFFPDVSAFYGATFQGRTIQGSSDFCDYLLTEAHVALVPGIAFGEDACIRLSYAASMKELEIAMDRLSQAIQQLKTSELTLVMALILKTSNFTIEAPDQPLVDRKEGGHVVINPLHRVANIQGLDATQAIELMRLLQVTGQAMTRVMKKHGVKIGRINYQDNGNWGVFSAEGPYQHFHLYGRAEDALVQKYGDACYFPHKDDHPEFYSGLAPLNQQDIAAMQKEILLLLDLDEYADQTWGLNQN